MEGVEIIKPATEERGGEGSQNGTGNEISTEGGAGRGADETSVGQEAKRGNAGPGSFREDNRSVYGGAGGTDGGGTAREGGETERAEGSLLDKGSRGTGTELAGGGVRSAARDAVYANLGEEVTSVVRRFPRINFEKVNRFLSSFTIPCAHISTLMIF